MLNVQNIVSSQAFLVPKLRLDVSSQSTILSGSGRRKKLSVQTENFQLQFAVSHIDTKSCKHLKQADRSQPSESEEHQHKSCCDWEVKPRRTARARGQVATPPREDRSFAQQCTCTLLHLRAIDALCAYARQSRKAGDAVITCRKSCLS